MFFPLAVLFVAMATESREPADGDDCTYAQVQRIKRCVRFARLNGAEIPHQLFNSARRRAGSSLLVLTAAIPSRL